MANLDITLSHFGWLLACWSKVARKAHRPGKSGKIKRRSITQIISEEGGRGKQGFFLFVSEDFLWQAQCRWVSAFWLRAKVIEIWAGWMLWCMENRSTTLPYVFIALLGKKIYFRWTSHEQQYIKWGAPSLFMSTSICCNSSNVQVCSPGV